ncbi:MAG: aquaporin [Lacipirellulaceae bacterium]
MALTTNQRAVLSELLGTFLFCFIGIAAVLATFPPIESGGGLLGVALAHGLGIAIAVNCFWGHGGAHFNPAVTVALLTVGKIKLPLAIQYIAVQILAAAVASLCCVAIFPEAVIDAGMLAIPRPGVFPGESQPWITPGGILLAEFLLTFLLMTAIYGAAIDPTGKPMNIAAFGIGLAVTALILAGGPITGASMNPARSLGPALVYSLFGGARSSEAFALHWCYWVATIAGAIVAAQLYEMFLISRTESGKREDG